ncbi:unnamed protein product [Vicia faba]|uniref:Uncharacterized protein n=1 Tax=Vicia faba TaxID=3906 RepID=A0AAV0YQI0_VICFA|nr:unnamed protein product [Vicia faba]
MNCFLILTLTNCFKIHKLPSNSVPFKKDSDRHLFTALTPKPFPSISRMVIPPNPVGTSIHGRECYQEGHHATDAAIKIQKHARRHGSRKAYSKLHASVLTLQTALRAIAARKEFTGTGTDNMTEYLACQTLLVVVANGLGGKKLESACLSPPDVEISSLIKWERSLLRN